MEINGTIYNGELMDILLELQAQLRINHIDLLKDIKDGEDNIQVTCPFHANGQERHPSFGIHKKTGIGNCFTCHTSVLLPEFISYCFGYKDAGMFGRQWLFKNFSSISIENRKVVDFTNVRSHNSNNNLCPTFVSEEELDKYRYYHPYWDKRHITDKKLIELFDLGYDANSKCITMPVRDVKGNTLFIARRSVNTKWFNYPAGVEKPLYGIYELTKLDEYPKEVLVCESIIDCLTSWQYGKPCVAMNGTGDNLQYKQLSQLPCRKLILCTDMDEAGLNARKKLKEKITNKLITELVWDLDKAKDLNDMSKEYFDNLREVW